MGLGPLHGVDAPAGPGKALPADLREEGLAPGAVFPLHLLGTPAHQHQDHLGRQRQVVEQGIQHPQVVGRQLFAQAALHLVAQGGEGGRLVVQGGVQILQGVFRGRGLRGGGIGLGHVFGGQPLPPQQGEGGGQPGLGPVQVVHRPPAQQVEIEQGRVPVVQPQQQVGGLAGDGQHLPGYQQLRHGVFPPFVTSLVPPGYPAIVNIILPQLSPFVNSQFMPPAVSGAGFRRAFCPAWNIMAVTIRDRPRPDT